MFGYADGYRPISAHRFIFLASKCSRICGRAFNSIFLPIGWSSALLAPELGSQFLQQKWQFLVPGEISGPARIAKTLLHEMDLKVAELALSGVAKGAATARC